jgi:hypothetical protein
LALIETYVSSTRHEVPTVLANRAHRFSNSGPPKDRRVGDLHTALGHHLHEVSVRQPIRDVPPYAQLNDLGIEGALAVHRVTGDWLRHQAPNIKSRQSTLCPRLHQNQFGPVQVNAGDLVSPVVCTAGAGATEATVLFANWTSGGATSFVIEAPAGTTLVGNCAEWVVERPLVNGAESMLADYGEVFFSGCDAGLYSGSGDLQVIGGGTQVHIDMIPPPLTTPLSAGILVAPEVVQCVYNGPR